MDSDIVEPNKGSIYTIENRNDCCTYKNQYNPKYATIDKAPTINPEKRIVNQYCLGVYVGSISILT